MKFMYNAFDWFSLTNVAVVCVYNINTIYSNL